MPILRWAADVCVAEGMTDEEATAAITKRWPSARDKVPALVSVARATGHFPAYENLERLEAEQRARIEREARENAARCRRAPRSAVFGAGRSGWVVGPGSAV